MNYNPLLSSLIEIFDGYSRFDLNGRTLFFRHFLLRDQNNASLSHEKYKNIAIKKGIQTKDQSLERIKKDECWNEQDDLKIAELQLYIENLKKTKDKLFLPSQKENHQKTIDEEQEKLNQLAGKRQELIGLTAEDYASKMSNEEFLRLLIYSDEDLKNLTFTNDEFGELSSEDILNISKSYFSISEKLNDETIQTIVLQDFFNMYISNCEDSYNFFGKYLYQMSAYQIKLLLYGRIFNNIFQYNEDIPDYIKKDPKSIFSFVDSKRNREKYQNDTRNSDGNILFGATNQDVDILDPNAKKISLADEIKKNGGSLSMEQMIDLMNQ